VVAAREYSRDGGDGGGGGGFARGEPTLIFASLPPRYQIRAPRVPPPLLFAPSDPQLAPSPYFITARMKIREPDTQGAEVSLFCGYLRKSRAQSSNNLVPPAYPLILFFSPVSAFLLVLPVCRRRAAEQQDRTIVRGGISRELASESIRLAAGFGSRGRTFPSGGLCREIAGISGRCLETSTRASFQTLELTAAHAGYSICAEQS